MLFRLGTGDEPVPRQRHRLVDGQHRCLRAVVLQGDDLVVDEAGRCLDRVLGKRRALAEVGIELDVDEDDDEGDQAPEAIGI